SAAFLFNWMVLPRLGGRRLWRQPEHAKGYPLGILIYPLAVLGLILVFHADLWIAATVWGVLAVGDGMASLVGQALRGRGLTWNRGKGWIGLASFVICGTIGASILYVWTLRQPLSDWHAAPALGLTLPLTLLLALVETIPTTLDDNLTIPLVGGLFLRLL